MEPIYEKGECQECKKMRILYVYQLDPKTGKRSTDVEAVRLCYSCAFLRRETAFLTVRQKTPNV